MEVFELQQKIIEKKLPKITILIGTEYSIIKLYIEQMCKFMGLTRLDTDSPSTILAPQKTISLVGDKLLYVARYDKNILTADKLWDNIKYLKNNYLVLVYTDIDKRSAFYKRFANDIVEFQNFPIETIKTMLKADCSLNDKATEHLISGCDNTYSRCMLELQKIKVYAKLYNLSQTDAYKELLRQGVIKHNNSTKIDEFVVAVLQKNKNCYKLYNNLRDNGVSNIQIIGWLYNGIRNQLVYQTVNNPTTQTTGLNYFALKQATENRGNFTTKELTNALTVLRNVEQGIKIGTIEEPISIEYILAEIL